MIDKITRKDFYDLVWSKPLKLIGEDLGLSYSELKKISKEYKIPLPENGFWTKKSFNKDVNVLPLIQYQEVPSEIVLHDDIEEDQTAEPTILQLTKKLEKELGEKTLVPKLIKSWHPLVARFRDKYVVYQNELKKGNWSNALRGELSIQVSDSHISRATRIFDTVIKILESRGHLIFIDHLGTNIKIHEHTYQLSIRTKNKRVVDEDRNYSYPSTKLIPLDILIFKIVRIYGFEFADTPNKPLEDKIDAIIARIELLAIKDTKMMEDARIQNRIYQVQLERREAIRKAQEQEKAKFEKLVQDAESWNKAMLIDKYLDEMEKKPNLNQDERDYIAWGRKKAWLINPLLTLDH
jgi:hypothetical protein